VSGKQQLPSGKHTSPALQLPQSRLPPQPFETLPQERPSPSQLSGAQQLPALQTLPPPQLPQSRMPPQPSLALPQLRPRLSQVFGWQSSHTFAVPAPAQVNPESQPPQSMLPPQPSLTLPHSAPGAASLHEPLGVQQAPW
jgi:hypothetical protein